MKLVGAQLLLPLLTGLLDGEGRGALLSLDVGVALPEQEKRHHQDGKADSNEGITLESAV